MTHCGRDDLFCLFERLRVSLLSGSFDSSILLEVKPPTGEPYAGDPPVRFGGRGSCGSPYPYHPCGLPKLRQTANLIEQTDLLHNENCYISVGDVVDACGNGLGSDSRLAKGAIRLGKSMKLLLSGFWQKVAARLLNPATPPRCKPISQQELEGQRDPTTVSVDQRVLQPSPRWRSDQGRSPRPSPPERKSRNSLGGEVPDALASQPLPSSVLRCPLVPGKGR